MDQRRQPLDVSIAAEAEKPVMGRLIQLYKHDFSEFAKVGEPYGEIGDDGLFKYDHLDSYWIDGRRKPFLFRVHTRIAGFALVNDWTASGLAVDYCIAEFSFSESTGASGLASTQPKSCSGNVRGPGKFPWPTTIDQQ